jgi:hypothetical protein
MSLHTEMAHIKQKNLELRAGGLEAEMIKLCLIEPTEDLQAAYKGTHLLSFGDQVSGLIQGGYRAATSRLDLFKVSDSSTWDSNPGDLSVARYVPPSIVSGKHYIPRELPEPDDSEIDE